MSLNRHMGSTKCLANPLGRLQFMETSSHQTPSSTIQSLGFRTSQRIARNARVCARFTIKHGPGANPRPRKAAAVSTPASSAGAEFLVAQKQMLTG